MDPDANIGEWRKLHNEELINLFQKLYIIEEIRKRRLMRARQATIKTNSYIRRVIDEEPVGKGLLGKPSSR